MVNYILGVLRANLSANLRKTSHSQCVTVRTISTSCARHAVKLDVQPRTSLIDVPTSVTVDGAEPFSLFTFKMRVKDAKGVQFTSHAHYVSDDKGNIDLRSAHSYGGSYRGCFSNGLFSTLNHGPEYQYKRFSIDVEKPWKVAIGVYKDHIKDEECTSPVSEVVVERSFKGPGVRRCEPEGRICGALFIPSGPGPHPAVIDMFGGAVVLAEFRSALLASRGIMSLSLRHMDPEAKNGFNDRLEIEYFEEAVDYLLSQPAAIPDRCGVIANCMSGPYGILMGIHIERVKAVYLLNGMALVIFADVWRNGKLFIKGLSLSAKGFIYDEADRALVNYDFHRQVLKEDNPARVPIELSPRDTHYSINAGSECGLGSPLASELIKSHLDRVGHKNYTCKILRGSGHLIELPNMPLIETLFQTPFPLRDEGHRGPGQNKIYLACGGNAADSARNQVESWQDMRHFVETYVRDYSPWYQQFIKEKS
ncbi:Acyl-CoA thioester hydrolase/bile acid-CoA amino acid N-acetyltransferase [Trinorchestia longiramus]|nr:Acyl-CoA thioester hydrolase/bile acid-CoA amino acid N-acetyltransferase [Trinorchestia longiramus]